MEDLINRINDELAMQTLEKRNKLIIDDLIDIYRGKYKDYDYYSTQVILFNAVIYEKNQKLINKLVLDGSMVYETYLDKLLLPEKAFNYILSKRHDIIMLKSEILGCIELLNIDGINSKEKVKTKLKEILEVL